MEGEVCKVRDGAYRFSFIGGSEGMGRVAHHYRSADSLLNFIVGGYEDVAFLFGYLQDTVIVSWYAEEVHRYDDFGLLRDGGFQLVVVHGEFARLAVDHDDHRADVRNDACRRRIGVRGNDYLVSGADAQNTQGHLGTGGIGVEADGLGGMAYLCGGVFQCLGFRAGSDPTGF
ncbi:hypothetical protein SDC9_151076 [bioreactor metagenome]|uniref:Uncharacterized protein n=1 Tax=bioreactor metagenome TaxID=1076179 RepID=A0A645ERF1_9ZZZZ